MTGDKSFPANLRYTTDHEWAEVNGKEINVGITTFAVEQLGDITLVNLDVKVGDDVTAGKAFGTIESVKTLSDLFAPVSGKVTRFNADLEGHHGSNVGAACSLCLRAQSDVLRCHERAVRRHRVHEVHA